MNGRIEAAFIGTCGTDADTRFVNGGELFMASVPVAVGAKGEEPQWIRIALFGQLAEDMAPRLVKGAKSYFEGTISQNHFTDRHGRQQVGLNLVARVVQPIGQIGRRRPRPDPEPQAPLDGRGAREEVRDELNDEIPF